MVGFFTVRTAVKKNGPDANQEIGEFVMPAGIKRSA
jgi:hypothetical protein